MLDELAAIILPVLIVPAIGFIWVKAGKGFDSRLVTQLVTNIGTPALAVDTLVRVKVDHASLIEMAGLSLACFAGFILSSFLVLRFMRLPSHSYLSACVFPNSGNMGLPLCLFAFGESGLALAVVFFTISATLHFTFGVSVTSGEVSVKRLLRLPIIHAVILALVVLGTGWQLPKFIGNTLHLLGGLTIPLMLLTLGISLATLKVTRLKRNLLLSLLRLGGGAMIGFGVGRLFGAGNMATGVLLIQSAMPVAVFSFLFAQYFDREPADVAAMVVISTILSFVSLPLLLLYFVL